MHVITVAATQQHKLPAVVTFFLAQQRGLRVLDSRLPGIWIMHGGGVREGLSLGDGRNAPTNFRGSSVGANDVGNKGQGYHQQRSDAL